VSKKWIHSCSEPNEELTSLIDCILPTQPKWRKKKLFEDLRTWIREFKIFFVGIVTISNPVSHSSCDVHRWSWKHANSGAVVK
jgi:hypothetical protein